MKKFLNLVITFSLLFGVPSLVEGKGGGRSYSGGGFSSGRSSFSSGRSSFSGSSGRSYSGGGKSSGSKSYSSPAGKSYSSGGSKPTPITGKSATTTSSKPTKSTYDSNAVREHKTAESRATYKATFDKGTTAKTEYKDQKGNTVKVDAKDKKIETLRTQLDREKWSNRELRTQNFYQRYSSPALYPPVYYHDPYNSFFWYWMLDRSLEERAMWAYCHRSDMDQARYNALLAKDSKLEARIKQLEANKTAVDPTYVPKGVEPDLAYTDSYVDAAFNPAPPASSSFLGWTCSLMFIAMMIAGIIWLVFCYRF